MSSITLADRLIKKLKAKLERQEKAIEATKQDIEELTKLKAKGMA